ncbi:GNAT family N-acetyltransferase [Micromonospora yangpuensis]|uniref:Acetyltransferase (GNAT) family protein n=1 Tax=Micromonospora yangpuensis TaxID=683228 RepID=A0A1C6U3N7_9ACTN|nr:GNAT family N-acetyltransferase [Micromonospora yangpuensis]GGL93335.1 N-acetyltransferase [Micromonospora yangpuensis]SCL48652.1 Acetyltransferase (GNAT) family protein [Micromonospora yangpuensis]
MTIPTVAVRPATPADTDALVPVLADAFFTGPVADWLVPDPAERRLVYRAYFTAVLHHGLEHGTVHTTDDRAGVAIWYPRLQPPTSPSREHLAALEQATGRYAPVFALLDTLFETHHPATPHHHLAYLAVAPGRQNGGIGAALLANHHRRLDAEGLPAYLEATNLRNRALYQRLGYRAGIPIQIPSGPTIWRMWRPGTAIFPPGFFDTAPTMVSAVPTEGAAQ